ncbi:L-lactate permease [Geothrix rubra]|uniref:L-lactate permease n=1 Tax=Geothrix rubra TaxID=2927977 RepID=A0ABQ5Q2P7_9BACT|nr:L-lactate permease [Geothrix rubra]GLH68979.1 L-lactate permease [Geothrix rubra]
MTPWSQIYTPVLGNVFLSALVAALPVIVLLSLLAFFHVKAHLSAFLGLLAALFVAVLVYHMPPSLAGMAAVNGALYGLLPIGWIVLNAIFVYDISVKSGDFEVVKHTIAGLASDRRIQALFIAFGFGAFLEGAAGFGTPVAISAAMLIGLGFEPLQAAGLALIGNTAPVAFGALGTPIVVLAAVTGLPVTDLSAAAGRILIPFSLMIPFWIIWVMAGRKAMLEIWPACLTAGASFSLVQFLVSNYHGPWVVSIASSIASMLSLVVLLRFWQPKTTWRFAHEDASATAAPKQGRKAALRAWMPWVLLSIFVFAWGMPSVKTALNGGTKARPNLLYGKSNLVFAVPKLNNAVVRTPPVVPAPTVEKAEYTLNWLSATGTSLLLAGLLGGLFLGFGLVDLLKIYWNTLKRVKISLLTIMAMLALGFTTKSAGLDATVGLAFASTGAIFPFFSAMLGWLGVALTGSDTSANVLFGGLQKITAQQLGLNPVLTAAANSAGGVMGKMIDAQSIVVASVATEQQGEEGRILRYVFLHSVTLAALVGLVIFLYAKVLPGRMMPGAPAPVVAVAPVK